MKYIVCILAYIAIHISTDAQTSNAILFTENGERFKVVLNGILQNATSETNVRLTQLPANNYKCRILFDDTKLGHVDFNLFFQNQGYEVTWNIKKNNKGEYVVRYVSEVPLEQAPVPPPAQKDVVYSTTPATTTTTTTVIHQETSTGNPNDVNINMGVNSSPDGANISIHASGIDNSLNENSYTTTTTTTTHTVRSSTSGDNDPPTVYVPGYTGKIGCAIPVDEDEFIQMKESIKAKTFDNTRLTVAKQIIQDNCLTASQVRETISLFDFENSRLDFAKFAYDHTYDIGNYYKVNDAFEFENSIDDLNKYISTHKK